MCGLEIFKKSILLICLASSVCYGEIYKWVDESGKVHYSQTPPNEAAEKIEVPSEAENVQGTSESIDQPTSNIENQKKYSDYLEQERLERKEKRDRKKQERAEARTKCHQTRAQLEDMNQGGILYYELDEKGERKFVADKRIEARKESLRKYLQRNCGGA